MSAPAPPRLTNWAGNITFRARRLHRPESLPALQRLVAGAEQLRALGTGHSFNAIADTAGDLVSVASLPRVMTIDPERATVTVSAGIRYGELASFLDDAGWALPNLGSLPHISVAGACATGTHGSGNSNGILATSVTGLDMVGAGGDLVRLSRAVNPERFAGAVVALGALGIVTSLTLDVVPSYQVRQYVYEDLPRRRLQENLGSILASGYSVSVVLDWSDVGSNQVWLKRRVDAADPGTVEPEWLGARLAGAARNMVPGMPAAHCTEQLGQPGPWHTRLPHFRLEFTPSAGDELQSEYLVPAASAVNALAALDPLSPRIADLTQVSELRSVAADGLWLSPSYHRESVAIHFTWVPDTAGVTRLLPDIEERLAPFAARPHWGKLFTTPPDVIRGLYPRRADFSALLRDHDPGGTFRNEFVERYVGEA